VPRQVKQEENGGKAPKKRAGAGAAGKAAKGKAKAAAGAK